MRFPRDERGADRQDERERHLGDDEPVADAAVGAPHRRVAGLLRQLAAGSRRPRRRATTPKIAAIARHATNSSANTRQSSVTSCARGIFAAPSVTRSFVPQIAEQRAAQSASERQHQPFRDELPHESRRCRRQARCA